MDDKPKATDAELLLAFVAERDMCCPLCGYNIRGLTAPRCPECGKALVLTVGLAEPALGMWLATLIPLCLSAGLGIVIVGISLPRGDWPWSDSDNPVLHASAVFFIAAIPLACALLASRVAFARLSENTQTVSVLLAVFASALSFMGFLAFID